MDLDSRLVKLLEHRDFFDEDIVTVEEDDIVLDVLIIARVKRPEDIGTSTTCLVIISDNDTDDIMVEGLLHRALQIQIQEGFEPR